MYIEQQKEQSTPVRWKEIETIYIEIKYVKDQGKMSLCEGSVVIVRVSRVQDNSKTAC